MHLTLLLFVRLAGGGEGAGDDVVGEEECGGAGRRGIQDTGKLGSDSVLTLTASVATKELRRRRRQRRLAAGDGDGRLREIVFS
jgi:hypothetical protein